jgi:hypothetical protein
MLFANVLFMVWVRAFGGAKRHASWRRQLSSTVILLVCEKKEYSDLFM